MPVLAGAEPFVHDGSGEIGVLLCHGFTSSPQSMRPWGEHLASAGYTVRCPLLPGHGTSWQELNRTRWSDWFGAVDTEFELLRDRCRSVFVFGQSMGGTLALRLAERRGSQVTGLVLVNPSVTSRRRSAPLLPLLSRIVPSARGVAGDIARPGVREVAYDRLPLRAAASLQEMWRLVRAELDGIRQPLLLFRSAVDHVVEPVNAQLVREGVRSSDLAEIVLPDSYHVATLDNDAPVLQRESVEFVDRVHRHRLGETV